MNTGSTTDTSTQLRLATRIHFALLRRYGEAVEVDAFLNDDAEAREALWVCQASGDAELAALARQFSTPAGAKASRASRRERVAAPPAPTPAPQDAAWARNTSGFGVSRPPELDDAAAHRAATPSRFNPLGWLRRSAR